MRFFRKNRNQEGWLAVVPQRDGLAVAHVSRVTGEKPLVRLAQFLNGKTDPAAIDRATRPLRDQRLRVTTVLGTGQYQLAAVEAPPVPAAEVKTAVRWRLKDVLDFPVDDATIDVVAIPVDEAAAARPQNMVFVVAARNKEIAACQHAFEDAKSPLTAIDIPEMVQRNLAALLETEGRGLAMLSFNEDGGLLTVSRQGELYLSRRIEVTPSQLLDDDHDRKHQCLDRITLELQRSLDNVERQFSFINVARLVLAPSTVEGLEDYLASNLYMPVATLDLAEVLQFDDGVGALARDQQQRMFLALGAALRAQEDAA